MKPTLAPVERTEHSPPPMTPEECERQVRSRYAPFFPDVERRVVFPEPFKRLLTLLGDQDWEGNLELRCAGGVIWHLDWHLPIFEGELEVVRNAGAWVELAAYRSKCWDFICVDPAVPSYGRIWEGEDAHPWWTDAQ